MAIHSHQVVSSFTQRASNSASRRSFPSFSTKSAVYSRLSGSLRRALNMIPLTLVPALASARLLDSAIDHQQAAAVCSDLANDVDLTSFPFYGLVVVLSCFQWASTLRAQEPVLDKQATQLVKEVGQLISPSLGSRQLFALPRNFLIGRFPICDHSLQLVRELPHPGLKCSCQSVRRTGYGVLQLEIQPRVLLFQRLDSLSSGLVPNVADLEQVGSCGDYDDYEGRPANPTSNNLVELQSCLHCDPQKAGQHVFYPRDVQSNMCASQLPKIACNVDGDMVIVLV